jgi:Flp pilus assembly protein TadD
MALDLAGRGGEALTLYERAGQDTTWLAPAIVRHADLLARLDRRDDADAVLAQAMDRRTSPELADARARLADGETPARRRLTAAEAAGIGLYGLGALAGQDSDGDAGLVILSLALTAAPKLDAALIAFADAQRAQSRGEAARAALAEIDPASPYAESARLMSAWILRDEGHEDAAIAAASAGASRQARTAHADLLRSFSRYGEAEPIYTGLIEENGEDWRLLFARGAVRERLKRWPEAEADLQRALALSPENPDVMNYLGYTWVDRGERRDEAMAMIARAAELRPNSGAIMDSLGWAHFRLGAYDLALGYLERAVELEPSDPILNDHLGDAYWRVGRRLEARFQWRRVLTLEPEAEQRAAVEAKVADGLPLRPLAENAR